MENLNVKMANCIKLSRLYMEEGSYAEARKALLQACECALLLAKSSVGKAQADYIATFETLKKSVTSIDEKMAREAIAAATASSGQQASGAPKAAEQKVGNNAVTAPAENEAPQNKEISSVSGSKERVDSTSPRWLSDYIGQEQAVNVVKELISAALLKGDALPHLILYGSHGLGKTTFSKIIANEMGANFVEVNVTKINVEGMINIFKQIKEKDILFIDEIHTLPLQVAESVMYSAMQDGRITYTEGKGKFAKTETIVLPHFTLIGATTEIGKLAKPFIQRAVQVRLEEYNNEVISRIIKALFYKLGLTATDEICLKIAKRCRNNPRVANNTTKRIADKAIVKYAAMNGIRGNGIFSNPSEIKKYGIAVTDGIVSDFFAENGIDEYGLEKAERELLRIMITKYGGGPVSIDTISKVLNEATNVISQKYEAYLIKKGMLKIEREGRTVLAEGYRALHMPVPESLKNGEMNTQDTSEAQPKESKYEKRKFIVSHVPDALKCDRIEQMIVYPENAVSVSEPLDTLFPDVIKPYDDITQHSCELELDFGEHKRLIECDSFLESRFATAMAAVGYVQDMKAQSLEIPYVSQQLSNRRYFPDFLIKDYKGRIAVIEMKNYDAACYHLNIDKYESLVEYCRQYGYGYAEVVKPYNADEYTSIELIRSRPVNKQLEEFIIQTIENNGQTGEAAFTVKDWDIYNEKYGAVEKDDIYTVLLNNRRLRNIDRLGKELKIILN